MKDIDDYNKLWYTQTQGCTLLYTAGQNTMRVYFGWVFVTLSGGLGNGEWVILIRAFCLLPLVY